MRTFIILAVAAMLAAPATAKNISVKPFVTKRGIYVGPSHRTSPDKTKINNYSSKPNVNPYTGKIGTTDPAKK